MSEKIDRAIERLRAVVQAEEHCVGFTVIFNYEGDADFVISGNTIENHTGTAGFVPIDITGERGMQVKGNIIRWSTVDR